MHVSTNPTLARGGDSLRLTKVHESKNRPLFKQLLRAEQLEFASPNPAISRLWLNLQNLCPYTEDTRMILGDFHEMLWRHSNRLNARFSDASGSMYFVFYEGSFAMPTAAFQGGCFYTREHIREMARLCHASPNMPASLLVSYCQQHMDLTVWDSSAGESAGIVGATPGQNSLLRECLHKCF